MPLLRTGTSGLIHEALAQLTTDGLADCLTAPDARGTSAFVCDTRACMAFTVFKTSRSLSDSLCGTNRLLIGSCHSSRAPAPVFTGTRTLYLSSSGCGRVIST